MLKMIDLFSGLGGFSYAAQLAGGFKTVAFCERDEWCQGLLAKKWPGVPIVPDIHDFRGDEYGPIDVVSGGFPCQPFSAAGQQRGDKDDRALWPEMRRIIDEARPTWVVGENVPNIDGMALDGVLSDLEAIGYQVWPVEVPACAVGSPQIRNRLWILAHANRDREQQSKRGQRKIGRRSSYGGRECSLAHANDRPLRPEHEICTGRNAVGSRGENVMAHAMANTQGKRGGEWRCAGIRVAQEPAEIGGDSSRAMAHAQVAGLEGVEPSAKSAGSAGCCHGWPAWRGRPPIVGEPQRVIVPSTLFNLGSRVWADYSARLRAAEPGWKTEAHIREVESRMGFHADGLSNHVDRIRALGNAIVPQVAVPIFEGIAHIEGVIS